MVWVGASVRACVRARVRACACVHDFRTCVSASVRACVRAEKELECGKLDRFKVSEVKCMLCQAVQPPAQSCSNCSVAPPHRNRDGNVVAHSKCSEAFCALPSELTRSQA